MATASIFKKLHNLIPHNASQKPASYHADDKFKYFSNTESKIWGYKDTLGISKIRFTDFLDKPDDSEKVTNAHERKSFFSSFSSPLNKIYDFRANSFSEIKKKAEMTYATIKESIKPVADKVYDFGFNSFRGIKNNAEATYVTIKESIKPIIDKVYDFGFKFNLSFQKAPNDPVEEIINTPEEELDAVFEKMTYEKLAELINNAPNEKAQELVNYIMPWHLEKVIDLILPDKLHKLFNENANNLSLDELTEQELQKLSNEDISDEQLESIIILAGEEKLAEKLDIIPNENLERIISNISNDQLATMINNASDENLERIVDSISNQNLPMILHLLPAEKIKQIMILIHGEEVVEQLEKQQLLEEILNTAERELDAIFEKMTDENLERIFDIIDSDEHNLSESLVKQIISLLYDKKCIQQEVEQYNSDFNIKLSGEVSDNDSGIDSDFEDEIEV